jgi:hypothetical protein
LTADKPEKLEKIVVDLPITGRPREKGCGPALSEMAPTRFGTFPFMPMA